MYEIALDHVKKYMDTTVILRDISFQINEGDRVGIIGDNGCGKTTVMRLIAGTLRLNHCPGYPYAPVPPGYDEGWVKKTKGITCAYLEQIPHYREEMKVLDVLKLSFEELFKLESQIHELEKKMEVAIDHELKKILKQYSRLMDTYESKGGYEQEEKLSRLCKGLKLDDVMLERPFHSLSGGEKTNVMLGKLLIDEPDVLLLDEPTNHLDMESVEWLQSYIHNYRGTVIVISHDRYFLDHMATKIIEIENKICKTYKGNYTYYMEEKEKEVELQFNQYRDQKKQISNMEKSIKELRQWGMKSDNSKFFKRAASMELKMSKMARIDNPKAKKGQLQLDIKSMRHSSRAVIKANALTKAFGEKILFNQGEFLVQSGERVALIGPNGCGKTTLLNILLGKVKADSGEVTSGPHLKTGYLPQNIAFEDEELTVLQYFRLDLTILEGEAREYLARFMFYGGNVFKKLKLLSGGERARLALSKLLFKDVNLLILDEPTNHLDIKSIEAIEEALKNYKGTLFVISHDRYFINNICNKIINIEENVFKSYIGNYDAYRLREQM